MVRSVATSACTSSFWLVTETYSPVPIENAPATRAATPVSTTVCGLAVAPPSPAISEALVTSPSTAPNTVGRSHPPDTSRCPCDHPAMSAAVPVRRPAATAGWDCSARQRGAQPGELCREGGRAPVCVEPAGVGQHPYPGLPDGPVLRAHRRVAAAERRPVGGDPHDREPAWLQSGDLFVQYGSALDELLGAELVRAGGGARDDVGDAEPEGEQLLLLIGPEHAPGEAGAVQGRPEAVPGPGEVVPGGGGVQAGVDASEQHAQAGRDDIGDRPVPRRVEVGLRRTRRAPPGL